MKGNLWYTVWQSLLGGRGDVLEMMVRVCLMTQTHRKVFLLVRLVHRFLF